MSLAVRALAQPFRRSQERERPALRPLETPRRRRPRIVYALTAVAGVGAIVAAQMALSIATSQTSFEIADLTQTSTELRLQSQQLKDEVTALGSPQNLAVKAAQLGMVIDTAPSYLRLSDHTIVGVPTPAGAVSSINVIHGSAIANSLLAPTPTPKDAAAKEGAPEAPAPALPPALDEGLPVPMTR